MVADYGVKTFDIDQLFIIIMVYLIHCLDLFAKNMDLFDMSSLGAAFSGIHAALKVRSKEIGQPYET